MSISTRGQRYLAFLDKIDSLCKAPLLKKEKPEEIWQMALEMKREYPLEVIFNSLDNVHGEVILRRMFVCFLLITTGVGMDECQGYFPKSIHDENYGRSSLIKMGLQHHPEFYKWVMDLSN